MTASVPEQNQAPVCRGESLLRTGVEILLSSGASVRVSGECMSPLIPEASSVEVKICDAASVRPGDVVLMQRGTVFVLHRYIGRMAPPDGPMLLTKADKSRRPDNPWPPAALVGKLTRTRTGEGWCDYTPGILRRTASAAYGLLWRIFLKVKGPVRP